MNRLLSVYIDVVRFAAAAAVFLAHLSFKHLSGDSVPWYISQFGDVAVAVFFVLSGFVIAHVVATRERDWKSYTVSRVSRLYSVILVAAVATLLFDWAGPRIDPQLYAGKLAFTKPPSVTGYAASALLVNEWHVFGFRGIAPGSNGPWWSLSFEGTYYLVAGFVLFTPRVISIPLSAAVLAMSGITIAVLFPLWWLGFGLYRLSQGLGRNAKIGGALFALGGLLLLIYPYVVWRIPHLPISFEFGRGNYQRHVLADYYSATAFAIHLAGAQMLFVKTKTAPAAVERFSRWLGSMTFPLYLVHFPMLPFFAAALPLQKASATQAVAIAACTFLAVAAITPVCDWLKAQLRSALSAPAPAC